jgi:hypothetical protein
LARTLISEGSAVFGRNADQILKDLHQPLPVSIHVGREFGIKGGVHGTSRMIFLRIASKLRLKKFIRIPRALSAILADRN